MISVPLAVPSGMQIVGPPSLSFTYSGRGTSRAVFARIVDMGTGTVLGNIVTPIPVTLDGEEYTVTLPLADFVYSSVGLSAASLTLQITSSATAFAIPPRAKSASPTSRSICRPAAC